jgi:hypothetical protein
VFIGGLIILFSSLLVWCRDILVLWGSNLGCAARFLASPAGWIADCGHDCLKYHAGQDTGRHTELKPKISRWGEILLDFLLLFLIAATLIRPLFKAGYLEKGPESPATLTRQGTDAISVHVTLTPGQSVVVQESYDPAWHAWSSGQPLPVRKDAMGFMVIDAPPWSHDIMLVFVTPLENQVGRILTAISILTMLALLAMSLREKLRG